MTTTAPRRLRRRASDAERALWRLLRNRRLAGFKFRRQHPVGPYIADFACVAASLVVELDGGQHADTTEQDARRTAVLEARGFAVLRFWNNEVLGNPDGVLTRILETLQKSPTSPRPSPPKGRRGRQ